MVLTCDELDLVAIRMVFRYLPKVKTHWQIIQNTGEIHEVTIRGTKIT
ncbi:MAG: hypothetical protein LBH74_00175 [Nitrososphaerota archaeon]|nr:hypothetical protein [Nitrososphaerota archaeon]